WILTCSPSFTQNRRFVVYMNVVGKQYERISMETSSKINSAKFGPMNPNRRLPPHSGFSVRLRKLATFVGGPKQLSERSGLSRAVIGKYLSGKSDPSRERLVKLADAAGISIRWLATGEGEMSRNDDSFVFLPRSEIGSDRMSVVS